MRQVDPSFGERLLVVTPTFNERETLPEFVSGILDVAPRAHVLVVDDASPDGTGALAESLAAQHPGQVFVLHRPAKAGLGSAYVAGFLWALARDYTQVAEMDADLSHDPRVLPRLAAALADGADLAVGSRNIPGGGVVGWGPGRHVLSKGGSLYARLVLGVPVADLTTGYKLYSRRALLAIAPTTIQASGYAFQIETSYRVLRAGLRLVEVPIVFTDRRVGQSKMSRPIFAEAVVAVWRLRAAAVFGRPDRVRRSP